MAVRTTKAKKPATTAKKKTTTTKAKAAVSVPKAAVSAPKAAVSVPKPAPAPKPTVVTPAKPVVANPAIKKPELIDRIVEATGMKKKDVKPVVEATLGVLGRALANEEELNLPPLGKVKINRVKDLPDAKILTLRLRQPDYAANAAAKAKLEDSSE